MFETLTDLSLKYSVKFIKPNAPLVFLVHGRAGTIDVMSIFRRSLPENWNVVQIEAPLPDPIGGFSWWRISDGSFDPALASQAARGFLRFRSELFNKYELDPVFEVGLGFSQGAGLLSVLLQSESSLFAGVGILAGFVIPVEEDASPIFSEPKPKIFWAHGERDPVIKLGRAQKGVQQLEEMGLDVQFVTDSVEHKVGSSGMRALKQWLHSFPNSTK